MQWSILSLKKTGCSSKDQTVFYDSNPNVDKVTVQSQKLQLSHNRSSDKTQNLRKESSNLTTLGIRKDLSLG